MTGFDIFLVSFCVAFIVASERSKLLFGRMMRLIRGA